MRYIVFLFLGYTSVLFAQERDLDFFIKTALSNAPAFRDLHNQVAINRQDSLLIRASLRPQVIAGTAVSIAPHKKGFGYDVAISNGGYLSTLIGVSQPVFVPKQNLTAQFNTLAVQQKGLDNAARLTEQDLRRTVGTQYITAYSTAQQLTFNRETLDLLQRQELVFKRLTEQNIYRQTDYLTFLNALRQQETTVQQLEVQYRNDLATLNYLCGITDTTRVALAVPGLQLPVLPPVEHTVFYQKYTIDSLQIRTADQLIDNPYRPTVAIFGDAGFNSSFISQGWKNFGFSIGIGATLIISDGKQRQLRHEKSVLLENTRQGYSRFFLQQYAQEIAQARQQLAALDQLDLSVKAQLQNIHLLIEATGRLIRTGDARVLDYLIAISNELNAQNQLTLNQTSRLQILNQLNFRNAPE
ncbi:MAG: TolC family protein [Haliscomenobacter sp.]|uniref:TolC family protein n=1 Tax=Haliscomenobacter sp. TaxID=2717303 RepID=UPI0029B61961|nr:TolC family protein [Haliscomenobacter sp.]MDX2067804.1 TolC family protein [Haliscomenobacter sp.]